MPQNNSANLKSRKLEGIDPIWDKIKEEAKEASSQDRQISGYMYSQVLSQKTLEKVLSVNLAKTISIFLKTSFSKRISPSGFVPSAPSLEKPFSIVSNGINDLAKTFGILLPIKITSLTFIFPGMFPRKLASKSLSLIHI